MRPYKCKEHPHPKRGQAEGNRRYVVIGGGSQVYWRISNRTQIARLPAHANGRGRHLVCEICAWPCYSSVEITRSHRVSCHISSPLERTILWFPFFALYAGFRISRFLSSPLGKFSRAFFCSNKLFLMVYFFYQPENISSFVDDFRIFLVSFYHHLGIIDKNLWLLIWHQNYWNLPIYTSNLLRNIEDYFFPLNLFIVFHSLGGMIAKNLHFTKPILTKPDTLSVTVILFFSICQAF